METFKRSETGIAVFLLFAFIAVLFTRTFYYDYSTLDDSLHIENNPQTRHFNLKNLKKIWTDKYDLVYTPVTYTLWTTTAFLSEKAGMKNVFSPKAKFHPGFFHLANVIFHFATAWMVFLILQALFTGFLPALFGALIFAVHPVQVETVTWITGLRDVLAGFFGMASLYLFIQIVQKGSTLGRSLLMLLTFVFSILSKSSGLVVIPLQFFTGVFLLKRPIREVLTLLFPLIFPALFFTPLFMFLNDGGLPPGYTKTNLLERLAIVGHNTGFYLEKTFFPLNNVFDYGLTPKKILAEHLYSFRILLVLAVFSLVWMIDKGKRDRFFTGLFLIFFFGFFPVSGIIPFIYQSISSVGDRYLYFSLLAFSLLIAYVIQRKPAASLLALFFFVFSLNESLFLIKTWKTEESFYGHILKYNPDSWLANNNVGDYYELHKDYEKAFSHYLKSAQNSNMVIPWTNAGAAAIKLGKYEIAEEAFRNAVAASKEAPWTRVNLATSLALKGQLEEAKREVSHLSFQPSCGAQPLIESKEAIEQNSSKKLKILRMDSLTP